MLFHLPAQIVKKRANFKVNKFLQAIRAFLYCLYSRSWQNTAKRLRIIVGPGRKIRTLKGCICNQPSLPPPGPGRRLKIAVWFVRKSREKWRSKALHVAFPFPPLCVPAAFGVAFLTKRHWHCCSRYILVKKKTADFRIFAPQFELVLPSSAESCTLTFLSQNNIHFNLFRYFRSWYCISSKLINYRKEIYNVFLIRSMLFIHTTFKS